MEGGRQTARGGEENWMMSACSGVHQGEEEGRTSNKRERKEKKRFILVA